ncbi:MAG: DUF2339 domain-containing protein [Solirubrobacteraceae bacterium]
MDEQRVVVLERYVRDLAERTSALEWRLAQAAQAPTTAWSVSAPPRDAPSSPASGLTPYPSASTPPPEARVAPPAPAALRTVLPTTDAPQRPAVNLEDLLGGRVLAWVGGLAVLVGVVLLLAYGVSQGWIGEVERTLMAAGGSLALLGFGVWIRERGGRVEAALAAAAAGVAALFTTITVTTQLYELIPVPVGIALATATAAAATVLAVRWRSQVIAALGVLGALLAPVLTDAPMSAGTVAFVFVALASAAGVLLWQRWTWLGPAAFVISAPQWIVWAIDDASTAAALVALVGFGLLNAALAIGFELRVPREQLKPSSAFLLVLGALALALTGWFAFETNGDEAVAKAWLLGLAVVHLAIGLAAGRLERVTRDLRLLVLTLGVVLGDVAFALLADGPVLSIGWTLGSVALAALAGLPRVRRLDATVAGVGLGVHICLALLHAVVVDAPPESVSGTTDTLTAILTLSAIAAGCFVSGRLAVAGHEAWRVALDALGLLVVAYLALLTLGPTALAAAWALEAAALAEIARRSRDDVASVGALLHLGGATLVVLAKLAPPDALIYGAGGELLGAALGLGLVAFAAVRCARLPLADERLRTALEAFGAVSVLYLVSVALISAFQPGAGAPQPDLLDLGVRQQGQMLLSALWAAIGACAVVAGLRVDRRALRLGGLSLFALTVGKVFLYDLAALTSVYRVVSFIALGLLLLGAAFAYGRLRPTAPREGELSRGR